MKLEKLTKEQQALIPVVAKRWIDFFKAGRVDPELAIKQIHWLYKFCKMDEPAVILVDSPAAAQVAANVVKTKSGDNVWDNVGANVRANICDNVWANVRANVWDNVGDNVWDNVWDNVRANVRANICDNVWANVRANVWDNVGANVRANIWDNVWANVRANKMEVFNFSSYGNISDYGWVAFYDYFSEIKFDLKNPSFFEFKELILSGVYDMIQFEKCCIAVSLPLYVKKDNKKRMHCSDGPAILFRDGYAQWYWKGTFVPRHWVEKPETISKKEIKEKGKNVEMRRVLIEILGVFNYYKQLGGKGLKEIDVDNDNQGNPMRLYSFDFEGRNIQMLECTCPSTKRIYNIAPPNQESRNVWDAKASICQLTEKETRSLIHES